MVRQQIKTLPVQELMRKIIHIHRADANRELHWELDVIEWELNQCTLNTEDDDSKVER